MLFKILVLFFYTYVSVAIKYGETRCGNTAKKVFNMEFCEGLHLGAESGVCSQSMK